MCLIAFAWQVHPRWRLVLAGNRDEAHARPSAALARWPDLPISGGRDIEAGGTWLAATDTGRCAVVTNVRDPSASQAGASRGLLVNDFLAGADGAAAHAAQLAAVAASYRPFNLLTFDAGAAFCLGNRPQAHGDAVAPGVHGLSNAELDTPWPKTLRLKQRLADWLAQAEAEDFAPLFAALADETVAADAELPDTGVGLALERRLSPAFVRGPDYGTRASTVVVLDHDNRGFIIERRFGPGGRFDGETRLALGQAGSTLPSK